MTASRRPGGHAPGQPPEGTPDTLLRDVLAAARRRPTDPAVTCGTTRLSYQELVRRAAGIARALTASGVPRPGPVLVFATREASTVSAFLGAWMAGAAYVPVSPGSPPARVSQIARETRATHLVGDAAAVERLGAVAPATVEVGRPEAPVPVGGPRPADVAYVVSTSGSTGPPKGVAVSHQALRASTRARLDVYGSGPPPRYLPCSPLDVDAFCAGLFSTLSRGGELVVPSDEEVADPVLLGELVRGSRAEHLDVLPSQYGVLLEFAPDLLTGLRTVTVGGEALTGALASRHSELLPGVDLVNEYGPTEATVWCSYHWCGPDDRALVPIGRPPGDYGLLVVDDAGDEVATGEVGQVAVSGTGLAYGYLGRPSSTAERFVPHPHPAEPGERLYLTGDLGHVLPSGELAYRGRVDDMVKVRGFRVEPAEVEAAIASCADVQAAVVLPETRPAGTTRLVALVVADGGVGRRALADHVRDRLPAHMVPAVWRRLDHLPVAPSGKVDRATLAVEPSLRGVPMTDAEERLPTG